MFGTLVTRDLDRRTLEFVENPDPVAAVSRNLQDKIRVACMFCRSRKARCSGNGKRCQRCVAMGIECVYPDSQARSRSQHENNKGRRAAAMLRRHSNNPARSMCDDADVTITNNQTTFNNEFPMGNLDDNAFDDRYMNELLSASWVLDTPIQHGYDSESSMSGSTNSGNRIAATGTSDKLNNPSFAQRSRDATHASSALFPPIETSFTAQLMGSSTAGGIGSPISLIEPWEASNSDTDMPWALDRGTAASDCDALGGVADADAGHGHGNGGNNFCCLLRSIAFLERLASRSASRETRIDSLLAELRKAIETLAQLLSCSRCATSVQQNVLLARAVRQVSSFCEQTANCYRALCLQYRTHADAHNKNNSDNLTRPPTPQAPNQKHAASSTPSSSSTSSSSSSSTTTTTTTTAPSSCPSSPPPLALTLPITINSYHPTAPETLHLLESLIRHQIDDFRLHLDAIKLRYRNWPDQGQTDALREAEAHVARARGVINGGQSGSGKGRAARESFGG